MTEQLLLDKIKADSNRIQRILDYHIVYPKLSIEDLTKRILYNSNLIEQIRSQSTSKLDGQWMQIHLYDSEPIYAKFKCYSNENPGYGLFYGVLEQAASQEKIYTPIPLDRCMLLSESEGSTLEFANGLNETKNCLLELGAITNG